MGANDRGFSAIRTDAAIDFHRETFVNGMHQCGDVFLDMRQFDELAAKISGIDHFQEVIEKLDDQRLIRKGVWCEMFEPGPSLPKV